MNAEDRDLELESGIKNRYIVLLLVLTGVLMAVVDGSVVSIALPTITEYFRVNTAQSQMIMTSYLVTLTSLLMIFGKVAEYVGKAKLFFLGIALFSFSSLACGMSTSLTLLVLCRIIQAAGAAMMFSISSAIIFQSFPRGEQGRAMGYIGAPVTGWIYDKHQFRYLAALGMMIMAISMILLGYIAGSIGSDTRLLLLTFVSLGIGGVFFQSPNNTEIMRALPRAKINIASSFTATIRNLGMALGVSFSGILVSLQLAQAGYSGTLVEAGPELLSATIS